MTIEFLKYIFHSNNIDRPTFSYTKRKTNIKLTNQHHTNFIVINKTQNSSEPIPTQNSIEPHNE